MRGLVRAAKLMSGALLTADAKRVCARRRYGRVMRGSAARSRNRPRRWLAAAVTLTAAVLAALLLALNGSGNGPPVYLVLAHSMIQPGESDTVVVVNKSIDPLNTTGAAISPRTSTRFSLRGHTLLWDDPHNSVPPRSRGRVLGPAWSTYPPGKYWVWAAYAGAGGATLYVHAKLTVDAR